MDRVYDVINNANANILIAEELNFVLDTYGNDFKECIILPISPVLMSINQITELQFDRTKIALRNVGISQKSTAVSSADQRCTMGPRLRSQQLKPPNKMN